MGILSGLEIAREVQSGAIQIEPFSERQVNPASYDLRLADQVVIYRNAGMHPQEQMMCMSLPGATPVGVTIDSKKKLEVLATSVDEEGLLLKPGLLYLMCTVERVHTKKYVPVLDGKSSIGRLGIFTHATAGYGDPGFDGQYTLEVTVVHPVRIYPNMRFAQIRFHQLVGDVLDYQKTGHYTNRASRGPVPSLCWRQFVEDSDVTE